MKRFAILPLLLFVFACGDTTTEPAMDDTLPTVAALEANSDSEGATFEIFEDGQALWLGIGDGEYGCQIALDNWSRARYHKASEQFQMRGNDVTTRIYKYDLSFQAQGEGRGQFFGKEDNLIDSFLTLSWVAHAAAEVVDAFGNRYQGVCHYDGTEDPQNPEVFITVDPK